MRLLLALVVFLHGHFNAADHVEIVFRQMVVFAGQNALEAAHRVFQLDVSAGHAGELLSHVEGLRQEALNAPGGSFICPYTSAAFSRMPASLNS